MYLLPVSFLCFGTFGFLKASKKRIKYFGFIWFIFDVIVTIKRFGAISS